MRPDPRHVRAVEDTARLLTDLGHDVREVDPRYPDPTAAFVPQFFGGIRDEADRMEHFERLERRTRETYRLGAWVRPKVIDFALRQTEVVSRKANRVFDQVDVLLTPAIAHRRSEGRHPRQRRRRRVDAPRRCPRSRTPRCGTSPATRPPPCRAGSADDGLPLAVQLVGRAHEETTLLSLSAQLEAARPWSLLAPG